MNPLYIGIDVNSKSNFVYFMLPDGSRHSNFSVTNSQDGSSHMAKRILSAVTSHSLDTVVIGLEATSVYGDNLVYFLMEDATLSPFNRNIHVLNPKQVKNLKEAYNDLPKNDYVDYRLSQRKGERLFHNPFDTTNALDAQIKEFNKAIETQMELLPNVLISIPGHWVGHLC